MYNLEYLPVALQDMVAIVRYISRELGNPAAADRLATELIDAGDSIPKFPIRPLKHEYRKVLVQNYFIFYWVDEEKKLITIARVVYAKSDYDPLLE